MYMPVLTDSMRRMSESSRGSPQSRSKLDLLGGTTELKVYANTLYAGDILAGEAACIITSSSSPAHSPSRGLVEGGQKMQQQRSLAAQKKLERLQLGGLAHCTQDRSAGGGGSPSASSCSSSLGGIPIAPYSPSKPGSLGGSLLGPAGQSNLGLQLAAAAAAAGATAGSELPVLPDMGASSSSSGRITSEAERNLLARGLATVYDPTEQQQQQAAAGARRRSSTDSSAAAGGKHRVSKGAPPAVRADTSNLLRFLQQPGPRAGVIQCYINREKGIKGHTYKMYVDGDNTFLLAAREVKKATGVSYVISSSAEELTSHSPCCMGKLRRNFLGTEFTFSDCGVKPGKQGKGGSTAARRDLGVITYQYNVLGTRGPRKMTAAVPGIDQAVAASSSTSAPAAAATTTITTSSSSMSSAAGPTCSERLQALASDSAAAAGSSGSSSDAVIVLRNKSPRWNESLGAYCLNFNGRVTEASVKNFQLVWEREEERVVLQFGKVGERVFTCDYGWPLTPVQAFAICLSSFDHKLGCE